MFRLSGSSSAEYRWTCSLPSSTPGINSTKEQFIVASHDYLAIGGGSAEGSNALRIDADLATCFAGPSDTFANPPLAPEEVTQPFMIGIFFLYSAKKLQIITLCCYHR